MNEIEIPEADRQIGTNHPRHTRKIYGHNSHDLIRLQLLNTHIITVKPEPFLLVLLISELI